MNNEHSNHDNNQLNVAHIAWKDMANEVDNETRNSLSSDTDNEAESVEIELDDKKKNARLLGARVLSSVNFEDSHRDVVQSSFERSVNNGEEIKGERPGFRRNFAYLSRLEKIVERYGNQAEQRLCRLSATNLIVKPGDIPEKFWQRENRRSIENGDGELTDEMKDRKIKDIQERQRHSVEKWSDYLGNKNSPFPIWFKAYVFNGISKMGRYDGENEVFLKRRKGDISSYPNLNEAALSQVYQAIVAENGSEPDVERLVANGNFNKLYSRFYTEQNSKFENIKLPEKPEDVNGKWIEYGVDQINELFTASSLNGCWCIGQDYGALEGYFATGEYIRGGEQRRDARENLASDTSDRSKFILFHPSDSENSEALGIPLVSIRLDRDGEVAEISGVLDDDNGTQILNDVLVPEVKQKVLSLPGGEKYKKAFEQREQLIAIHDKIAADGLITGDDLAFLWAPENTYHSIGRYEHIEGSSMLAEAKEKTKNMFAEKENEHDESGAMRLSVVLEEYGLDKSVELVPQLAENGVDLDALARMISGAPYGYPDVVTSYYGDHKDELRFLDALLENGASIGGVFAAIHKRNFEWYSQPSQEVTLLKLGISPESILKSLNKNERKGRLPIQEYTKNGMAVEEVIPLIDLTYDIWTRCGEIEEYEDSEVQKLFDRAMIEQLKQEIKNKAELFEIEDSQSDKKYHVDIYPFTSHLAREKDSFGFLDHIDDAVDLTTNVQEANRLLRCGANPDLVLNRELKWAEQNNEMLDGYVDLEGLSSAYLRQGGGTPMADYLVEKFSPEFVAEHANTFMDEYYFGVSAEAVAKRLNGRGLLYRINDLYQNGAAETTLANRVGEELADVLALIYEFANNLDTPSSIAVDGFKDALADAGGDVKVELKNILQAMVDSIE